MPLKLYFLHSHHRLSSLGAENDEQLKLNWYGNMLSILLERGHTKWVLLYSYTTEYKKYQNIQHTLFSGQTVNIIGIMLYHLI